MSKSMALAVGVELNTVLCATLVQCPIQLPQGNSTEQDCCEIGNHPLSSTWCVSSMKDILREKLSPSPWLLSFVFGWMSSRNWCKL